MKTKTKKRKLDKYDKAIEYLREHPEEIRRAWSTGTVEPHPGNCLFIPVHPSGNTGDGKRQCGCLTQIVNPQLRMVAYTPELTMEIRKDKRIPNDVGKITVEDLGLFAEWQRKIDKILKRK